MSKKQDLLQEAIADAKRVKEIAYENAKVAIEEAFQPKIQRMISTKLAEEEYDEEMPTDEFALEPEMAPRDEFAPEPDYEEEEEEEPFMESYMDDGKNGTPDNPLKNNDEPQTGLDEAEIDEEFERIIRELEGGTDADLETSDDSLEEMDDAGFDSDVPEDSDELEDMNLESLVRRLEVAETKARRKVKRVSQSPAGPLQTENARLKSENNLAFKALAELKSTMNEVNLLNSKLMYSSRIIQSFNLTEAQQVKILETFDRANSVREVKLIYSTIQEHYKGRLSTQRNKKPTKKITESGSRTIRTVKKVKSGDGLMEGAHRWQQIAGLKPIND
tara:strand:- start:6274 stop:7269 length:996 start_codon:yes stop_codon:yes gene_type:complete